MPHYYFYEMGRNFYTFGDRHSLFITGYAVFMRYACMDALKCEDPGHRPAASHRGGSRDCCSPDPDMLVPEAFTTARRP